MDTAPAGSVGDLVERIAALVDGDQPARGLRWWFRGARTARHDLVPFVMRGYSPEQERYLYNEFYARAGTRHTRLPDDEDLAGWLSLMQHYRLPTRLLDWSFSPLVAAYFAVEESEKPIVDAAVWALAPSALNEAQELKPLLYPLNANALRPLLEPAKRERNSPDKILAAMAVETDARMQMQQGAFTVHGVRTPLNKRPGADRWLRRIPIPSDAVTTLRRELRLLGMRRDYLFPDLESLASELRARNPPRL